MPTMSCRHPTLFIDYHDNTIFMHIINSPVHQKFGEISVSFQVFGCPEGLPALKLIPQIDTRTSPDLLPLRSFSFFRRSGHFSSRSSLLGRTRHLASSAVVICLVKDSHACANVLMLLRAGCLVNISPKFNRSLLDNQKSI